MRNYMNSCFTITVNSAHSRAATTWYFRFRGVRNDRNFLFLTSKHIFENLGAWAIARLQAWLMSWSACYLSFGSFYLSQSRTIGDVVMWLRAFCSRIHLNRHTVPYLFDCKPRIIKFSFHHCMRLTFFSLSLECRWRCLSLATFCRPNSLFAFCALQNHVHIRQRIMMNRRQWWSIITRVAKNAVVC